MLATFNHQFRFFMLLIVTAGMGACAGLNLNPGGFMDSPLTDGATSSDTDDEDGADDSGFDPDADIGADLGEFDVDTGDTADEIDIAEIPVDDEILVDTGDDDDAIPAGDEIPDADVGNDGVEDLDDAGDNADDDASVPTDGGNQAVEPDEENSGDDNSIWVNPDTGAIESGPTVGKVDGDNPASTGNNTDPQSNDPDCENTTQRRSNSSASVTRVAMLTAPSESDSETMLISMNLQSGADFTLTRQQQSVLTQRLQRTKTSKSQSSSGSSRLLVYAELAIQNLKVADPREESGDDTEGKCEIEFEDDEDGALADRLVILDIIDARGLVSSTISVRTDTQGRLITPVVSLTQGQSIAIRVPNSSADVSSSTVFSLKQQAASQIKIVAGTGKSVSSSTKTLAIQYGALAQVSISSASKRESSAISPLATKGKSLGFTFSSSKVILQKQ